MKIVYIIVFVMVLITSCSSQKQMFSKNINTDCFYSFSDLNYDLVQIERKIIFKLVNFKNNKNKYDVYFYYMINKKVPVGYIRFEGNTLYFSHKEDNKESIFFNFDFKVGHKWEVRNFGLFSKSFFTLVEINKQGIYRVKIERIGPISSNETYIYEILLSHKGLESMKLKKPGTGKSVDCSLTCP